MRILYYVPIAHLPEEIGTLAKPLLEIEKRVHGPQTEKIYREKVAQYWKEVNQCLEREGIFTPEKCKKMHIYIDGLPQAEDQLLQKVVEKQI